MRSTVTPLERIIYMGIISTNEQTPINYCLIYQIAMAIIHVIMLTTSEIVNINIHVHTDRHTQTHVVYRQTDRQVNAAMLGGEGMDNHKQ